MKKMRLNAPTQNVFIISVIIAVIGLLMALGVLAMIPVASFWVMAVAYVVLAAACVLKGM